MPVSGKILSFSTTGRDVAKRIKFEMSMSDFMGGIASNVHRRKLLKASVAASAAALAGCTGGEDEGYEGNVESEIDGVTASDVDTEETTVNGTDVLAVTATITNENGERIEVEPQGAFYDSDGNELNTISGCIEVDRNTDYNGHLIGTDRIDDADRYEVTLVENTGFVC